MFRKIPCDIENNGGDTGSHNLQCNGNVSVFPKLCVEYTDKRDNRHRGKNGSQNSYNRTDNAAHTVADNNRGIYRKRAR